MVEMKPMVKMVEEEYEFTETEVKSIIVGSVYFMLIFGIPKTEVMCKRVRKKTTKAIQKEMAKLREKNPRRYVVLVNEAHRLIKELEAHMATDDDLKRLEKGEQTKIAVSPAKIAYYLKAKYADVFYSIGYNDILLDDLMESYGPNDPNGFRSLMFVNRVIELTNLYYNRYKKLTMHDLVKQYETLAKKFSEERNLKVYR